MVVVVVVVVVAAAAVVVVVAVVVRQPQQAGILERGGEIGNVVVRALDEEQLHTARCVLVRGPGEKLQARAGASPRRGAGPLF